MPVDMSRPKRVPLGTEYQIESIEIQPAVNGGFAVRTREKMPEGGDGMSMPYREPKLKVFADMAGLVAWLPTAFTGDVAKEPAATAPAAPAADDAEYEE